MDIFKEKPKPWNGEHILLCAQTNSEGSRQYAMYCDFINETTKNYKIRVYGIRDGHVKGWRDVYVDKSRVKRYSDYFKD